MSDQDLAPLRLTLSNGIELHRDRDQLVKIVKPISGKVVAKFPKEDWTAVAAFFNTLTSPGILL